MFITYYAEVPRTRLIDSVVYRVSRVNISGHVVPGSLLQGDVSVANLLLLLLFVWLRQLGIRKSAYIFYICI